MDYSRPVTAGSEVVMLRGGYRVQVTVGHDFFNPAAAGIVEVVRYGPAEQDSEDENGEEEDNSDAEEEDDDEEEDGDEDGKDEDAPAPPTQLLSTSPAPTRRTPAPRKGPSPSKPAASAQQGRPAPRKGPAASIPNALLQQARPAPRKGPPPSNSAALPLPSQPSQKPTAPTPGQGQDRFGGLGPLNSTCDACRAKKKGCNGSEQRPCTRCANIGLSAAECIDSRTNKTVAPRNTKKRDHEDDEEDEKPSAKRGRGRPRKNSINSAPVYSAADGVSAVAGRGIHVPVKK